MDEPTQHPDDATLLDLVDGSLDAAAAATVRAHLEQCATCVALVEEATGGAARIGEAVVPMPEVAATAMRLRLASEWRSRLEALAAQEAAADTDPDAAHDGAGTAAALEPLRQPPRRDGSPWRRRLVPILAFGVLAMLAGTSIVADDTRRVGGTTSRQGAGSSAERAEQPAAAPAGQPESARPAAGAGAPGIADEGAGTTAPDARSTATPGAAAPGSAPASPGATCVAGTDRRPPVLPGGLLATRVVEGPLGLLVACG